MDQSCRDIPMRLDIKHQPLNFDIYLSQVIDIPKTSVDERPYDFRLEHEALRMVDSILERTTKSVDDAISEQHRNLQDLLDENPMLIPTTVNQSNEKQCNSQDTNNSSSLTSASSLQPSAFHTQSAPTATTATTSTSITPAFLPPPSCPIETPLTPIKCFIEPTNTTATKNSNQSNQETSSNEQTVNQINPRDFEEMHYNPFDHLELQTIDELRELDLVFQASYANQASKQ